MCTCDSSTLDGLGPRYRGLGCECPTEEEVCLNPADNVSDSGVPKLEAVLGVEILSFRGGYM